MITKAKLYDEISHYYYGDSAETLLTDDERLEVLDTFSDLEDYCSQADFPEDYKAKKIERAQLRLARKFFEARS